MKSKQKYSFLGLLFILLLISCIGTNQQTLPTIDVQKAVEQTLDAMPKPINPSQSSDFIKSIEEFVASQFCIKYGCIALQTLSDSKTTYHPYVIGNYPKYNEFLIEITTVSAGIIEYSITLDPKEITRDELQLIETLLNSLMPGGSASEVMDFVEQNLDNDVNQICRSNSIEFGTKHIWVGRIGLAPSIMVANTCIE